MSDHLWLAQALLDADLKPRSYSGRGMYGRECLGYVTDSPLGSVASILFGVCQGSSATRAKEDIRELAELLQEAREDSMGLSTIVYFPAIKWHDCYETGEEPTEEDNEDSEDEGDCDDSDDGGALASAGMGTDEDYGGSCIDD